jgi:arginase
MAEKLQIISVMSELGAGTRGASLGFYALEIASLQYDRTFFKEREPRWVKTENNRLYQEEIEPYAKRLDGIAIMYNRIQSEVSKTLNQGDFPLVIAGDHSNAGGTIAGIKKAYPNQSLGVIWVDAHADLHSPYTSPSGNVHGMPLATALHEDNLKNKNNQPEDETIWHWNEMKGPNQRVKPEDVFFIGLRDTETPEDNLIEEYKIPVVTTQELRKQGPSATAKKALEHLKNCDLLYVSFDVDSLDTSVSVGTGTPVPGGLLEEEARQLLTHLVQDPRLCCLEMVEVNPLLDLNGNSMAEAAFRILKPVTEKLETTHLS